MKYLLKSVIFGICLCQSAFASGGFFGDGPVQVSHANSFTDPAVVPANNNPSDIQLSNTILSSGVKRGVLVGELTTIDPDSSVFTYSFVGGSGSNDNDLFFIANNGLYARDLSNMSVGSYFVRIKAEDNEFGRFDKSFNITISENLTAISTTGTTTEAIITGVLMINGVVVENGSVAELTDKIDISMSISFDSGDVGQLVDILVVATLNGQNFMLTPTGWVLWNGMLSDLEAKETITAPTIASVDVVSELTNLSGDFAVFAGYRNSSGAAFYNSIPITFTVE